MPILEDLYEAVRQNVQLAVRDGHEIVYVERLAHPEAVRVFSRVGGRWPLHPTAVGQVLLAHAPAVVQESVLAERLPAFTPRTITDPVVLRRMLAAVRRDGVAVCDGMIDLAALSVAAPVRGEDDSVVAALSVVVPSPSEGGGIEPRTLVPAVRAAARGHLPRPRRPVRDPHRRGRPARAVPVTPRVNAVRTAPTATRTDHARSSRTWPIDCHLGGRPRRRRSCEGSRDGVGAGRRDARRRGGRWRRPSVRSRDLVSARRPPRPSVPAWGGARAGPARGPPSTSRRARSTRP